MKKIGFIGCGKMGQAIIEGLINSGTVEPDLLLVSAKTEETRNKVKERFGVNVAKTNIEVAKSVQILFLAIKPQVHETVIDEIKRWISSETIIITIAAGIDLSFLEKHFDKKIKAICAMPNTPSLVREGMTTLCVNESVTQADLTFVCQLFKSIGRVEVVEEKLMEAIPAISGSSPAYVYMFIEALADGGVRQGIPRNTAYKLAAQSVLGAAKMVLETGEHPGVLKDQVCTPGGATIEAVKALEENNFRGTVLTAMEKCSNKVKSLKES